MRLVKLKTLAWNQSQYQKCGCLVEKTRSNRQAVDPRAVLRAGWRKKEPRWQKYILWWLVKKNWTENTRGESQ